VSKLNPNARWRWLDQPNPIRKGTPKWQRIETAREMRAGTVAQLQAKTQRSTPYTLMRMGLIGIDGVHQEPKQSKPKKTEDTKSKHDTKWAESFFDEKIKQATSYGNDTAYEHYRKVMPMPAKEWACFQQLIEALSERVAAYGRTPLVHRSRGYYSDRQFAAYLRKDIADAPLQSPSYTRPIPPLLDHDPFVVLREEIADYERATARYANLFNRLKADRVAAAALAKKYSARAKVKAEHDKVERERRRAEKAKEDAKWKEFFFRSATGQSSSTDQHLKTLNLSSDATSEQIKVSYRTLIKQLHPDTNKNATAADSARLQLVLAAMEALRNAGLVKK
jgi:hypothetical protein